MRLRKQISMLAAMVLLAVAAGAREQKPTQPDLAKLFDKSEVMIAVRDGTKLHTEIYTPKDAKEPLPIIMMQDTVWNLGAGQWLQLDAV